MPLLRVSAQCSVPSRTICWRRFCDTPSSSNTALLPLRELRPARRTASPVGAGCCIHLGRARDHTDIATRVQRAVPYLPYASLLNFPPLPRLRIRLNPPNPPAEPPGPTSSMQGPPPPTPQITRSPCRRACGPARSSGSLLLHLSEERFGWLGGAVSKANVDHPRIHGIRWTRPSASTPCATV